jgi:transposase
MKRNSPYFLLSHRMPRVDERRVLSAIIHVLKRGLQWRDAPREYGPYKALNNQFVRWSRIDIFDKFSMRIVTELTSTLTNRRDTSQGTSRRFQPAKKEDVPRNICRRKDGLNSKLNVACDSQGRPVLLHLTAVHV